MICGKLGAIISDLESLVFARLKFFESWLPDNDKDNFYMEREWRKIGGLAFSPDEVTRLIVPSLYAEKLATDFPQYSQIIHSV